MAGSDNVSPQASAFGTQQSEGIVVCQAGVLNAPGGFILGNVDVSGNRTFYFFWVDTSGNLRRIQTHSGACIFDESTNQITFTNFDQDASGTVVGP